MTHIYTGPALTSSVGEVLSAGDEVVVVFERDVFGVIVLGVDKASDAVGTGRTYTVWTVAPGQLVDASRYAVVVDVMAEAIVVETVDGWTGEVVDRRSDWIVVEPARPACGHCLRGEHLLEATGDLPLATDSTGTLACFGCYVPDITGPKYQGATEDFLVAAPGTKVVSTEPELVERAIWGDR